MFYICVILLFYQLIWFLKRKRIIFLEAIEQKLQLRMVLVIWGLFWNRRLEFSKPKLSSLPFRFAHKTRAILAVEKGHSSWYYSLPAPLHTRKQGSHVRIPHNRNTSERENKKLLRLERHQTINAQVDFWRGLPIELIPLMGVKSTRFLAGTSRKRPLTPQVLHTERERERLGKWDHAKSIKCGIKGSTLACRLSPHEWWRGSS